MLRSVVILRSIMPMNMCKFARTTGERCYSWKCSKWPRPVWDRPVNQVSTHAWSFLTKRFFNTSSILSSRTTRYDHTWDISPLLTVHSVHKHHWGSWIPKPSPFTASRLDIPWRTKLCESIVCAWELWFKTLKQELSVCFVVSEPPAIWSHWSNKKFCRQHKEGSASWLMSGQTTTDNHGSASLVIGLRKILRAAVFSWRAH
jgi:hypothetical protein